MKQQLLRSAFSAACLFALALCLPALAQAATLNVPSQYATIQAAINAASNGDTVLIADGTYTGPGNVGIDCQGTSSVNHRGFYLHSSDVTFGYSKFPALTQTVTQTATTTTLASNLNPSPYGQYPVLTATVTGSNPTGTVTFIDAATGVVLDTEGLYPDGIASFYTYGLTIGSHQIMASYGGDSANSASKSAVLTQVVSRATTTATVSSSLNPAIVGQSVTFNVDTMAGGGPLTGTVTLAVDGVAQTLTNVVNSYNSQNSYYEISASYTTPTLSAGSHSVTLAYGGDSNNTPSTSATLTQTVNAVSTTMTTLISNLNPSAYGQFVSLTANVFGNNPTGTVTFTDTTTGAALGTATLSGEIVSLYAYHLATGSHQITASYRGDIGNTANTSPALVQVVSKDSTATSLVSSVNPSLSGQSVTVTAELTGASPNEYLYSTPTGTFIFTVDGTAQAPVSISSGYYSNGYFVSFTIPTLSIGSHTITAVYSGDTNFTASSSQPLTQTVNPHINPQYVSLSGSDSNPGTQASPKLTIQAAINSTISGDSVIVEDGTYTGPGDVDVDFGGRNIIVKSQNGAETTIIDCGGNENTGVNHRGFYLHDVTSAVISGFTIQNGYEYNTGGGAILDYSNGLTIQNCVIKNNTATLYGGGIYSSEDNSSLDVIDCIFTGNTAGGGGGVYNFNDGNSTLTITNCTFTGNTATSTNTANSGGGIFNVNYQNSPSPGALSLINDIFYGDTIPEVGGDAVTVSYCDIQGGYAGTGNINADPLFVNSPTDLHLGAGSPCLGAGTTSGAPTTTIDGVTRPNPPSIGAYEGVPVATTVSVANVSGTAGQSVTLSATLTATSGGGLSGKTLAFNVDGVAAGTVGTNGAGTAGLTFAIPATANTGSHTISVSFAGDSAGNASSGTGALTVTAPVPVGQVRYWPRSTYPARMVGGLFQGSSDNAHWTTLATVTQTPPVNAYSTLTTSADPATFRYLRYLAPNGSYGNVAEIEFDSHGVKLTGTGFGTAGSYNNSGNTFAKALDGNTGTFFDAPAPGNGDYVGIDRGTLTHTKLTGTAFGTAGSYKNDGNTFGNVFDGNLSTFFDAPAASGDDAGIDLGTGQAAIVTRIGYCPRSGYASRMVGGVFQGSNDNSSWTALYTVTAAPATGALTQTTAISSGTAYRYLRYLAPNGSYGNVAEVEFDTSP